MKKKLSLMMAIILFSTSTVFAQTSMKQDLVTLNKVDQQALFGDSRVHATPLSNNEMIATEGEGIWFWVAQAAVFTFRLLLRPKGDTDPKNDPKPNGASGAWKTQNR